MIFLVALADLGKNPGLAVTTRFICVAMLGLAGASWFGFDIHARRPLALGFLVAAAITIDAGAVCNQTIGRRATNMLAPEARNRLNGIFSSYAAAPTPQVPSLRGL